MDTLRFTTAGSVDDGKSTLIGRLLLESRALLADQVEAVRRESRRLGHSDLDLSLFTDGLRDEREQKITIDVAYRYFSTPRRKFIIADCPGHAQYTRNMVTGASTSELAVILLDVRKGLVTQGKRHAFLCTLLGLPHLVVAVNKMDLVDYDQSIYNKLCDGFREFSARLDLGSLTFLPLSALHGDNVVEHSPRMPWYDGATLLHHLETVNVGASRNVVDFRFPVQVVLRPHQDYRGYAGRVASGRIAVGEEVVVLPSGATTTLVGIEAYQQSREAASVGDSVVLRLADDLDVGRGDMIVRRNNLPIGSNTFDAVVCCLGQSALEAGKTYTLLHGTRSLPARINALNYRIDVDTLHREAATTLELNDIGRIRVSTAEPLFFDPYRQNRATGCFLLVDPVTHETAAAGMIRGRTRELSELANLAAGATVDASQRSRLYGHKPGVVWLTGLSGSGKSTLAEALERHLAAAGVRTLRIDGDTLRAGLCADLGFSPEDRGENLRRAAHLAALAHAQGMVVICSLISPFARDRALARSLVPQGHFLEVHVDCTLDICRQRDPKGLYTRVDSGELHDFTGVDSPYEAPLSPELRLDTASQTQAQTLEALAQAVDRLIALQRG